MTKPTTFTPVSLVSNNDRLLISLIAATLLHALLMGSHFSESVIKPTAQPIEITLIDTKLPEPPKHANFLAEEQHQGAGQKNLKPTPPKRQLPHAEHPDQPSEKQPTAQIPVAIKAPVAPKVIAQRITAKPDPMLIASKVAQATPAPKPQPQATPKPQVKPLPKRQIQELETKAEEDEQPSDPEPPAKPDTHAQQKIKPQPQVLTQEALRMQIAQLGKQIVQQEQEREASTTEIKSINSVSTQKFVAAQYIQDWERKVEQIGNMNYPEMARKNNFNGRLTLDVGINADGSIYSMRISKSSGYPELDAAAKKIVKMSAPFAPLPKALLKELNVLVITRVWSFSDESGLSTH